MIESRWTGNATRIWVTLAFVFCSIHPGWAQNGASSVMEGLNMEKELRRAQALQAIQADRAGFVEGIVSRWMGLTDDDGAELRNTLLTLSDETLAAVDLAETLASLDQTLFDPLDLGDDDSDLVFFPLTPCRIIDTRLAGGILAAGVARGFDSQAPYTSQGGQAASCGVPGSDVAALALTVVAVTPTGAGNLRAWPFGGPLPNAVAINYTAGQNLANTTIVPLTQGPASAFEFSAQANVSNTHLVADVVGYFWSPNATPLSCTTVQNNVVVANNAQINFPPGLVSGTCPAGYTLTGGGNQYSGGTTGFWWWNSHPSGGQWVTAGRNETGGNVTVTAFGVCCRIPGR